jgi:nitroreductase
VCPTAAISIHGKKPEDSLPLSPGSFPAFEQMSLFVRGRRSIRHYKDENVDPTLVERLLSILSNVPTGVNRRELTFTLIDDRTLMQKFRDKVLSVLAERIKENRIPERAVALHQAVPAYFEHGVDILFRGAPHLLVVSAPPDAPCAHEDVSLALAYFELLAQSAGLGTVWCGFLKMTFEILPELKVLLGLTPDHLYYAMLFGLPAIRFARTVQRDNEAVIKRVNLQET